MGGLSGEMNRVFMSMDGVPLGALSRIHPEPQSQAVEQFLAMLRFDGRSKLAELPDELVGGSGCLRLKPKK
jgi:hypothetical protein